MVYSLLYSTSSYMIYSIIICYIAHSIKHVLYSMVYSLLISPWVVKKAFFWLYRPFFWLYTTFHSQKRWYISKKKVVCC